MNRQIFQIIDANLNRLREGLRVSEDILRFAIAEKTIARALKNVRHSATKVLLDSDNAHLKRIIEARDTKKDVLKFVDFRKKPHTKLGDMLLCNIERSKESLRVLEECWKLVDEELSGKYRQLRFNVYDIEKKIIKKLGPISGN